VSDLLQAWSPQALLLAAGVAADLALGDPVYAWHPVRLIGRLLTWFEARLRAIGLDGYGGGILPFLLLSATVLFLVAAIFLVTNTVSFRASAIVHVLIVYSLLALGDLVHHVRRIESAVRRGDLTAARAGVSLLVGRDTDRMDGAACRRAAVESLSENLADGFTSPVLWYAVGGIPGLVLFKIVSTMDSMVGYKTPQYLKFGWCGARLDDVMNYIPARLTWLLIVAIAALLPRFSGRKAWTVGLQQHALLLGPNSGWSEAGTAGALERRIVGPIWLKGTMVTDLWIGDASDPPLAEADDVTRALVLAVATGLVTVAIVCSGLASLQW
jgi:adenosylcobinamide-phosphate synthase